MANGIPDLTFPKQTNAAQQMLLMLAKDPNSIPGGPQVINNKAYVDLQKFNLEKQERDNEVIINVLDTVKSQEDLPKAEQALVAYFGPESQPSIRQKIQMIAPYNVVDPKVIEALKASLLKTKDKLAMEKNRLLGEKNEIAGEANEIRQSELDEKVREFDNPKPEPESPSTLKKLIKERNSFPKGSKERKLYDLKLSKETTNPKEKSASFGQETQLRGEFERLSADFVKVRDSYNRVVASVKDPSAAGDLSLIFNYMKILDPGSVVRESEFATAAASGSLGQRFVAVGKKLMEGERLSTAMRKDFTDRAVKLYKAQLKSHKSLETEYTKLSTGSSLDPKKVVVDFKIKDLETGEDINELTVGSVYRDAKGVEKVFGGVDSKGKKIWKDK